jgi:hypothetical protein
LKTDELDCTTTTTLIDGVQQQQQQEEELHAVLLSSHTTGLIQHSSLKHFSVILFDNLISIQL